MAAIGWNQTTRWLAVAGGVGILVATPVVVNAWPVPSDSTSATRLLTLAQASSHVTYSGTVETDGTIGLPVVHDFQGLANLFGGHTSMRVWWRADDDWRVDTLAVSGETDLYRRGGQLTSWDYEHNEARTSRLPKVRLPLGPDLLPPVLARRMLQGVTAADVTRIGSDRVAGIDAPGIRVTPPGTLSSIGKIDIWVDPTSGLPLEVAVYGDGQQQASIKSSFSSLDVGTPPVTRTRRAFAPGADVRHGDDIIDIAAAENQYAHLLPPPTLDGLAKQQLGSGSVGVYGEGATVIIAMPVWYHAAEPLRSQIEGTPGSAATDLGVTLTVGPLNLLLTSPVDAYDSWLVAGTVTQKALAQAAAELVSETRHHRSVVRRFVIVPQ